MGIVINYNPLFLPSTALYIQLAIIVPPNEKQAEIDVFKSIPYVTHFFGTSPIYNVRVKRRAVAVFSVSLLHTRSLYNNQVKKLFS